MISPARKLSYKLLFQIGSEKLFSDDALNSERMERLEVRDRHLTTEIVYGTLRWQGPLDYVLARASSIAWHKVEPGAKILLRMSLYQMWRMDRIPDHALVNDAVEIAKRELGKGIDRYVNGILRRLTRSRPWSRDDFLCEAPPWVRLSLPQWLWERWAARYGDDAAGEFAESLVKLPQPAFRLSDRASESPGPKVVCSEIVPGAAIGMAGPDGQDRAFRYQDEASQLIPHLLGGMPGLRIWDACAAPGGKTAILCGSCGEQGRVTASDLREERVSRIAALLESSGNLRADLLVADASRPAPFRRRFDAVLADVPCSGLGTLRRNPEIKWRFEPEDLDPLQRNQRRILDCVSAAVRVGGSLLYSTCSTEPEENEEVVKSFLNAHLDFSLKQPDFPPGIERWTGEDRMVRTFPGKRLWDGFFAALMIRHT